MSWLDRYDKGSSRPAVVVYVSSEVEEKALKVIGAGSEEEGIPLLWNRLEGTAQELAKKACQDSSLQVGIGVDDKGTAITFLSYREKGVYLEKYFSDYDRLVLLRWTGRAAARFVKREPVFDDDSYDVISSGDSQKSPATDSIEDIVKMVMADLERGRRS